MEETVVIITTGGTISMRKVDWMHVNLSRKVPIANVEGIASLAKIEQIEFSNIPSPYMTPDLMWDLSLLVRKQIDRSSVKGVVISHGTDTLEETSYFLDLTVQTNKPVVLTAAMRNINELGTDGPRNIFSSVKVAASPKAREVGVVVCLNDEIHAAREVTKTYTSNVATFESPGYGPLGIVDEDGVFFFRRSLTRTSYRPGRIESNVPLIKTFTGDQGFFFNSAMENGCKGIVLEGFGRGNVPPSILPALDRIIQMGIAVVLVSRCYKGRVLDIYSYEGGGADLKERGVILGHETSAQKARIKLMVLLGMNLSVQQIRREFEMSDYSPKRRDQ